MNKHDDTKDENTNNNILGGFDFSAIEELDPSLSTINTLIFKQLRDIV